MCMTSSLKFSRLTSVAPSPKTALMNISTWSSVMPTSRERSALPTSAAANTLFPSVSNSSKICDRGSTYCWEGICARASMPPANVCIPSILQRDARLFSYACMNDSCITSLSS